MFFLKPHVSRGIYALENISHICSRKWSLFHNSAENQIGVCVGERETERHKEQANEIKGKKEVWNTNIQAAPWEKYCRIFSAQKEDGAMEEGGGHGTGK